MHSRSTVDGVFHARTHQLLASLLLPTHQSRCRWLPSSRTPSDHPQPSDVPGTTLFVALPKGTTIASQQEHTSEEAPFLHPSHPSPFSCIASLCNRAGLRLELISLSSLPCMHFGRASPPLTLSLSSSTHLHA